MSYKRLGDYIQPVNIRNKELEVTTLLGVSVKKKFIPSIANTVGTDFKKYKIVKKHQFVYIPDTSRRGEKIGIAMLESHNIALVSQAYTVFEIEDQNKLRSEYLMMWFRRPEFDRYARVKSHGSVREIFDWDEMCSIELPIPSIEKQQQIVAEYNTVKNRIQLNEQLNQKLEATAQALYKHWFVDFEFPIDLCQSELVEDQKIDYSKGYKSSGGKMVYNEELEKDIPVGWSIEKLKNVTSLLKRGISPKYTLDGGVIVINQKCIRNNTVNLSLSRFHNSSLKSIPNEKLIEKLDVLINSTGTGTLGRVGIVKTLEKVMTVDSHVTIVRANNKINKYYLASFLSDNEDIIVELGHGSTGQTELSRDSLGEMILPIPSLGSQKYFELILSKLQNYIVSKEKALPKLQELQSLLLAKMTQVETKLQTV